MIQELLLQVSVLLAIPLTIGYGALALLHFVGRRSLWRSPVDTAATIALAVWPLVIVAWFVYLLGMKVPVAMLLMICAPTLATVTAGVVFLVAWAVRVISTAP